MENQKGWTEFVWTPWNGCRNIKDQIWIDHVQRMNETRVAKKRGKLREGTGQDA